MFGIVALIRATTLACFIMYYKHPFFHLSVFKVQNRATTGHKKARETEQCANAACCCQIKHKAF